MMPSLFVNSPWIWDAVWQSSALLACGLLAARVLRARPSMAHAVLSASLLGAVIAPLATMLVRDAGWGVLAARPAPEIAESIRYTTMRAADEVSSTLEAAQVVLMLGALASGVALLRLGRQLLVRGPGGEQERDERVEALAWSMGVRREVRCVEAAVSSPSVRAWPRRVTLVLPVGWLSELTPGRRAVLAHELMHVVRRDHVARLAHELAACVLAWNPLAWMVRRAAIDASELACDASAVRQCGSPERYAEELYSLCAQRVGVLSVGAVDGRHPVVKRFARILSPGLERDGMSGVQAAGVACGGVALCVGLAVAQPRPTAIDVAAMPVQPEMAPQLREGDHPVAVSSHAIDLGMVDEGAYATGWLYLTNLSDEPVLATGMDVDCGCTTVAGFEPGVLEPGETLPLLITMQADVGAGQLKVKDIHFEFETHGTLSIPVSLATY